MAKDFYMTLPSNSSRDYFPDNTTSKFRTKLPQNINLEGEWEVGLRAINFPHDWYTITTSQSIRLTRLSPSRRVPKLYEKYIRIEPTYFATPSSITEYISKQIELEFEKPVTVNGKSHQISRDQWLRIEYDEATNRAKFVIPGFSKIAFSTQLGDVLGVDVENETENSTAIALPFIPPRPVDVLRGYHSMYVYCDIIEHGMVGDRCVPLLTICDARGERGMMIHRQYDNPEYKPVQKKTFDALEININNYIGEPMPFQSGPLVVTLHFRKVKNF